MRKRIIVDIFTIVFIVAIAALLRLYQLGNMPNGLSNDEASYIYSSYSVWKTGRGIDGVFLPISFNTDSPNSPVPIYIDAPFVGIFGVSPFSGRLPYALAGIGSVVLIYYIAKFLFANKWIGLASAFVMAISPWQLQVSRGAFDATIGLFFYLLGVFIFLKNSKKGNILWSLIPFFLAFYSYHATKFVFLFLLPFLLMLFWKDLKKQYTSRLLFLIGYACILFSFLGVIVFAHETRQDTTLLSFSNTTIVHTVQTERATSLAPHVIQAIFNNKPLTFLRTVRENFLEPFSPQFLFLYGDTASDSTMFGLNSRGEMYIIELPLLLMGIVALLKKYSSQKRLLIFGSLVIAVLPTAFTVDKAYVLRAIYMIPFLCILVGIGIYQLVSWKIENNTYKKIGKWAVIFCVILLYAFLFAGYLYQYYARYPVYSADVWKHDNREISKFLALHAPTYKHVYIHNEDIFLLQYAIFARVDPRVIQKVWKNESPQIGNMYFHYPCPARDGVFIQHVPENSLVVGNGPSCILPVRPILQIQSPLYQSTVLWNVYKL